MSIESEVRRFKDLNFSLGKRALNALYPDDIEIYILALELVNSDKETEEYFIFPVNPNSISEPKVPIQSIKKTAGGITVMNTTTFSPSTISLRGNFGRKFKFLAGQELVSFSSINIKPTLNDIKPTFSKNIKTGYGCLKLLESIIEKSNSLDKKGQPYALYFYNLALGNNYLVKSLNLTLDQTQEMNMIWSYSLQFQALAKVENLVERDEKALTASLSATSMIENVVNNINTNSSLLNL
jgi:hypothetical protein